MHCYWRIVNKISKIAEREQLMAKGCFWARDVMRRAIAGELGPANAGVATNRQSFTAIVG